MEVSALTGEKVEKLFSAIGKFDISKKFF